MADKEDQERKNHYAEIISNLLDAGYFRVQIKKLSEFDKVIGGMCWCITSSGEDVDVDILFQENSTIGQKIALAESIVNVMRKMGCPHPLQPHQIQGGIAGVNHAAVSNVIVWLIKKYAESKSAREKKLRKSSTFQYKKNYEILNDLGNKLDYRNKILDEFIRPSRVCILKNNAHDNPETRVVACLLEFGESMFGNTGATESKDGSSKAAIVSNGDVSLKSLKLADQSQRTNFEKVLAKAAKEAEKEDKLFYEQLSKE